MARTFSATSEELELVRRARKQDINAAHKLLINVCDALRDCRRLSHEVGNYIADAIEGELRKPGTISKALGLVRPNHRPSTDAEIQFRAITRTLALHKQGMPLKDGRSAGAWSTVAQELGISPDTVAAIWKKFRAYERFADRVSESG